MIALLDYGAGNLRSVEKALRYVGSDVELMQTPDRVKDADAVVLPGVGAFDDCINAMALIQSSNAPTPGNTTASASLTRSGVCINSTSEPTYRSAFSTLRKFPAP